MAEIILGTLSRRRIHLDKLAFQSYDYANAMMVEKISPVLDCHVPYIP